MYNPLILPDVRQMLAENDKQGLGEFCNVLHAAVIAEILEGLTAEEVWKVLDNCSLERQVEVFEFLSIPQQMTLVESLDRRHFSKLLEAMSPDDRVDLLSRLDDKRVEALLPFVAQAERSDIRKLLSYPEDSAGSIMTTEYASLPEDITVRDAVERLRKQAPDRETIYYVYILEEGRRLHGLTSLRDLILARPEQKLADIMQRDVISVRVTDDQEFVAQQLAKYDFIAIPVVDNQNQLVGIVTHDDVLDVMQEEATEDAHRLAAVGPLKDSYLETRLPTLAWKRGVWLMFLAFVALGTAQVLQQFQGVSQQFVWLVWFLPLVMASGGNAGSQSATLVIRTLATEQLTSDKNIRMAIRELLVGLALGPCLGITAMIAALLMGRTLPEACVVSFTVFFVVVMGTVTGAVLPLVFKRLGMDPALMSNPLIAAIIDVVGVVTYYTVAMVSLESLAAV